MQAVHGPREFRYVRPVNNDSGLKSQAYKDAKLKTAALAGHPATEDLATPGPDKATDSDELVEVVSSFKGSLVMSRPATPLEGTPTAEISEKVAVPVSSSPPTCS